MTQIIYTDCTERVTTETKRYDFGVADKKGRAIGASVTFGRATFVPHEPDTPRQ